MRPHLQSTMHNQQKNRLAFLPMCGLLTSWQFAEWQWGVRSVTVLEEWRKARQKAGSERALGPPSHLTPLLLSEKLDYGALICFPQFTSLLESDCCSILSGFHESCASSAQAQSDRMAAPTLSPRDRNNTHVKPPWSIAGIHQHVLTLPIF